MSETSLAEQADGVPAGAARAQHEKPALTARLGALFRLFYLNLIGTILTLGIYRFWAKTRMRRYVWSHVVVGGQGFEYTGTGKELLFGFLKALVVLVPPLILLGIIELLLDDPWSSLVRCVQYVALVLLFVAGSYAARRYRMSRTRWGGIRFHQSGSPWRYTAIYLKGGVLLGLTLGLYAPYLRMRLAAYETDNLHFGSQPFAFSGGGRDLFKSWLIA